MKAKWRNSRHQIVNMYKRIRLLLCDSHSIRLLHDEESKHIIIQSHAHILKRREEKKLSNPNFDIHRINRIYCYNATSVLYL